MANIANKRATSQGPWGAWFTKKAGSHLAQGREGGALTQGKSGSHLAQMETRTRAQGSKESQGPNLPGTDKTSVRGGGTNRTGNSRNKVGAGHTGSKNAQNPNVKR